MTRPKREPRQPETVWLTDDQQRAWRQLLSMIMELPAALESDLQRTTGLFTFEYLVLANLSEADGKTLRMSELAVKANSSVVATVPRGQTPRRRRVGDQACRRR
jgi:hypothetical protein